MSTLSLSDTPVALSDTPLALPDTPVALPDTPPALPDAPLVEKLGYVAYGVPDLDGAVEYYQEVCRLALVSRRDDVAFLTGSTAHHWLRLERRPTPGLIRVGFEATSRQAIGEVAARLEARGVPWTGHDDLGEDKVVGGLRFRDPDGIEVEVYEEMAQHPFVPTGVPAGMMLLHVVVNSSDIVRSRDYYRTVLGLRRSDQIERFVVFLRAGNGYHHSIAFAAGSPPGKLDHFAVLVEDLDTVMLFRAHAAAWGVLPAGEESLVRHVASGSVSTYLRDYGNDLGIEFCTGHAHIDDLSYGGRLLVASAVTANRWARGLEGAEPPTAEQRQRFGPSGPLGVNAHQLVSDQQR